MRTILALLAIATASHAQDIVETPPAPGSPAWSTSVRLSVDHTLDFDTDIADASLTTNTTRAGVALSFVRSDRRLALGLELEGAFRSYDFDDADTLIAGLTDDDPFDTFTEHQLRFTGRYAFDETWGIAGLASLSAAYERGAELSDAIQGGGAILGTWTSADGDLSLGFGVGGFTRLDEDPVYFPIANLRWRIDDELTLATEQLGLALTYEPCDEFDFSLFGRYDRADYRLDDDRGDASEGVLKDNRVSIGARLAWSPRALEGFTLSLTGGAHVYRRLEILDDDADELFEDEADPAAFMMLGVLYEF